MKRNPMYLCVVLIAAMSCIAAHASTYNIKFTGSGLVPTKGSFNYDPVNGFSNFLVYWPQILGSTPFDLTSAANNPIGGGCGTPTAALAFALLEKSLTGCSPSGTYGWTAAAYGRESPQTLDFTYGPTSTYFAIDIHGTAYCSTCASSVGNFGSWTISVATASPTSWRGPSSGGLWSKSANWTGGTPTASTDVFIDNGNSEHSAVTLDIGGQAHNLTIDSDDSLTFNNNTSLTINGSSISNAGKTFINAGVNHTDLILAGSNTVTLSGGGTVTLGNNINNRIYSQSNGNLINQETIQGAGQIGVGRMGLVNAGTINANQSAGILLSTNSKGLSNTGTLQTAAGDTMHVTGGPFTNFSGSTLTGGSYVVAGTLQIDELGNTGGEIVTDAAKITLSSSAAKFVDAARNNALSKLATITSAGAFTISGTGDTYTTAGNFTNNGILTIGAGSKFDVKGNLTNFSGTTLTRGTYNVSGLLQFNGANIVTNAASITLTGTTSKIVDQTGTTNGLANFATNAATGSFKLASSRSFTTVGNFSNAGTVKVSKGSTFTVASTHNYTQTAGTTTNDGTMAVSSGVTFAFNGGWIFGNGGTFTGNVTSGGTFNIGDVAKTAGKLAITGAYTQSSSGALNIDIGGLTPGTLFDQLNVSGAARLGGTLNLDLINSFTPKLGSTFDIMNFASETGTFAAINGTSINSSEHFQVVVNPSNVTLDVVSGPVPPPAASFGSTPTPEPSTLLLLCSGTLAVVAAYRRGKLRTR